MTKKRLSAFVVALVLCLSTFLAACSVKAEVEDKKVTNVIKLIDAIPTATLAVENRGAFVVALNTADTAYEALSAAQKVGVTNSAKLTEAKTKLADFDTVQEVIDLINEIPDALALDAGEQERDLFEATLEVAKIAYGLLSSELKSKVSNHAKIGQAELKLKAYDDEVIDLGLIAAVAGLVDLIPAQVDDIIDFELAVETALAAYEALSPELRERASELMTAIEVAQSKLQHAYDTEALSNMNAAIPNIAGLNRATRDVFVEQLEIAVAKYNALRSSLKTEENRAGITAAEQALAEFDDEVAVEDVEALIDLIPATVDEEGRVEFGAKLYAAQTAYNNLRNDDLRGLVSNKARLATAEQDLYEYNQQILNVIGWIAEIPEQVIEVEVFETALSKADTEYNKLTAKQQELVTNTKKLEDSKVLLANYVVVNNVIALIDLIPDVLTCDNEEEYRAAYEIALAAYEELSSEFKGLIINSLKLISIDGTFEDLEIAMVVYNKIEAFVLEIEDREEFENTLEALEAEYDELTTIQKAYITNSGKFAQAWALIAGYDAVQNVIGLIEDISDDEIDSDNRDEIAAQIGIAQTAYDALDELSPDLKSKVTNAGKLENAQAELQSYDDKLVMDAAIDAIGQIPGKLEIGDSKETFVTKLNAAKEAYNAVRDAKHGDLDEEILAQFGEEYAEIIRVAEARILDYDAAKFVYDLIAAIPANIDIDSTNAQVGQFIDAVVTARAAYGALIIDRPQAEILLPVDFDVNRIEDAEAALEGFHEDILAIAAVIAKIAMLPEAAKISNRADVAVVESVRGAYDLISGDEPEGDNPATGAKAYVYNYDLLATAEAAIAELEAIIVNTSIQEDGIETVVAWGFSNGFGEDDMVPDLVTISYAYNGFAIEDDELTQNDISGTVTDEVVVGNSLVINEGGLVALTGVIVTATFGAASFASTAKTSKTLEVRMFETSMANMMEYDAVQADSSGRAAGNTTVAIVTVRMTLEVGGIEIIERDENGDVSESYSNKYAFCSFNSGTGSGVAGAEATRANRVYYNAEEDTVYNQEIWGYASGGTASSPTSLPYTFTGSGSNSSPRVVAGGDYSGAANWDYTEHNRQRKLSKESWNNDVMRIPAGVEQPYDFFNYIVNDNTINRNTASLNVFNGNRSSNGNDLQNETFNRQNLTYNSVTGNFTFGYVMNQQATNAFNIREATRMGGLNNIDYTGTGNNAAYLALSFEFSPNMELVSHTAYTRYRATSPAASGNPSHSNEKVKATYKTGSDVTPISDLIKTDEEDEATTKWDLNVDPWDRENFLVLGHSATRNAATSACVAEGTLVTMADGSQKPVEDLEIGELVRVWNLFTGSYDVSPVVIIERNERAEYEIVHLYFSDGTEVKVTYEHGFWDVAQSQYVQIMAHNVHEFVGSLFKKENGDNVTLERFEIYNEVTTTYNPITFGHINLYLNGMLTLSADVENLVNIFEVDPVTMKIDAAKMQADIELYGLFTYEEFIVEVVDVPEIMFQAFNAQFFKVAIGKGTLTVEEIQMLVDKYSELLKQLLA